ncbi:MAG TPA: HigA family addiction module antitoxin [Microvirga sp.]|jgi:addiction module HigA family antidote|nr:HigA family addiction module antitoxin [Microvirga sp.]
MQTAPPKLPPLHPGEVLREEFMKPLGVSALSVARRCGVPRTRIERIAAERIGITADTALRLGRCFSTTPQFWLNLQSRFDLERAEEEIRPELERIEEFAAPGASGGRT